MDWTSIYTTNIEYEANLLLEVLQDNGIEAVTVNQTDSMYKFGEYVINVNSEKAVSAKKILEEYINSKPDITNERQ